MILVGYTCSIIYRFDYIIYCYVNICDAVEKGKTTGDFDASIDGENNVASTIRLKIENISINDDELERANK